MHLSFELWIEYLLRFSHLVAGIAWIGNSFYFIWLDSIFELPETKKNNVEGELFMVHGGYYYHVEKKKIFPGELPKTLHWFKWEATLTWATGFLLLIAVYYLRGASLLIDTNKLNITQNQAILLSLTLTISFWFLYDFLWIHDIKKNPHIPPKNSILKVSLSFVLIFLLIYINTHSFSGRGAFIQTGFMLGSMMLLNVWFRILPGQRKMITDAQNGKLPDYSYSLKAKLRSVHNTYFIFPILFIMISNHYSMIYNHPQNWLLLILLSISGALTRHAMVTQKPIERWTLLPASFGLIALIYLTGVSFTGKNSNSLDASSNHASTSDKISFNQVKPLFQNHCVSCHSSQPTDEIFKAPPKGISLTSEIEISRFLPQIHQQVSITKLMPFGNKTKMSEEERNLISTWINQQTHTDD